MTDCLTWCCSPPAWLLAQSSDRASLREIREGFREARWEMPWQAMALVLGATLLVLAAISARRWWLHRYDQPGPAMLFSAIARKVGLSWTDRLLLWRIARHAELSSPIALLLARGALKTHAQAYYSRMRPHAKQRTARRIDAIHAILYRSSANLAFTCESR